MKLHVLVIVLLIPFFDIVAQQPNPADVGALSFNVPPELRACLKTQPSVEIYPDINPFYLSGDFDGDGLTDFAAQVVNRKDRMHGLVICFATGRSIVIGAGQPILWSRREGTNGDWPFDAWLLIPKGSKQFSSLTKIKHDSVGLIISEVNEGILYWDGRRFQWWMGPGQ